MLYPTDRVENLRYRAETLEAARDDEGLQSAYVAMAAEDPEWWFATFVWTYRPQAQFKIKQWPFIPWKAQRDEALPRIFEAIETGHDLLVEKTRETGGSWQVLMAFQHYWLFSPEPLPFLAVSRNEDAVDKSGDPNCLFWKFDYALERLPSWMRPSPKKVKRNHLLIRNDITGSVLTGLATTGDMGAGGRAVAMLGDEWARIDNGEEALAATADICSCRIFVSTAQGRSNSFWTLRESGKVPVLRLYWEDHPEKARGLYECKNGKVELLDDFSGPVTIWRDQQWQTYEFPDEYPFEDVVPEYLSSAYPRRSPWLDSEMNRRASRAEIAQEIMLEYLAAGSPFFDLEVLDKIEEQDCRAPDRHTIHYYYEPDRNNPSVRLGEKPESRSFEVDVWMELKARGRPPADTVYAVGVDVSVGTGASNSVAQVFDVRTGEQVAQYADPGVGPERFARRVVALCKWLGGVRSPYLLWEMNGPGLAFGNEIRELGYSNIYYNRDELSDHPRKGDRPGWHSHKAPKRLLLAQFRGALPLADIVLHCQHTVEEAREYVRTSTGGVEQGTALDDSTGAREDHGDRVIAAALGARGVAMQRGSGAHRVRPEPPPNSYEGRRRRARQLKDRDGYWGD
ncbi:MAG: hypothetical protein ACOC7S_00790 [Planctomycetota bacterium]